MTQSSDDKSTGESPISVLYAKSLSHVSIIQYDIGKPITIAMITSRVKSLVINNTILDADAPNTLRIPISLVFCAAENDTNPNSPRHAITIASRAKTVLILAMRCSLSYKEL